MKYKNNYGNNGVENKSTMNFDQPKLSSRTTTDSKKNTERYVLV